MREPILKWLLPGFHHHRQYQLSAHFLKLTKLTGIGPPGSVSQPDHR